MNIVKHSYNGSLISQESDGYVSLTDMAKASGKQVNDYLRLESSKSYIEGLSVETGITVPSLTRIVKGKGKNQGTWAHPEVAIDFAQWCSVPFRIWANRTLRGAITQISPEPKRAIEHYSDRVMQLEADLTHIPDGYWVVMQHCGHILLKVEKMGYPVGAYDLCDGSIGSHWSAYRKALGLNESLIKTAKYKGVKQAKFPVKPKAYPFEELGIFAKWLKTIYSDRHLPEYLKDKYGKLAKS